MGGRLAQRRRRRRRRGSPSYCDQSSASVTTCKRRCGINSRVGTVNTCCLLFVFTLFLLLYRFKFIFIFLSYVPALRPLRQQAFLLAFPQTQPSRLAQRLAEVSTVTDARTHLDTRCRSLFKQNCCLQISLRQGLKADTGTLMSLCEKTDNDIRSCINTLQVGGAAEKESPSDAQLVRRIRCKYVFVLLSSSFIVVASSSWTARQFRASLWGRRTRTKACSICGRKSSSYHVQNGTASSPRQVSSLSQG